MNARRHEGKIVGVIEKPQNDWVDSAICEIWAQKNRHALVYNPMMSEWRQ